MSKFKTVTGILFGEDENIYISNNGEKDRPNYKPKYTENGAYELVEDGKIHSYEEIQSWKATCDLSSIVERYIKTGDSSLLNNRAGFYADVTNLPKNYVELANTLQNANTFFNMLPPDVKEEFEYNPAKFYAQVDDVVGFHKALTEKKKTQIKISDPAPAVPVDPTPVPAEPIAVKGSDL